MSFWSACGCAEMAEGCGGCEECWVVVDGCGCRSSWVRLWGHEWAAVAFMAAACTHHAVEVQQEPNCNGISPDDSRREVLGYLGGYIARP